MTTIRQTLITAINDLSKSLNTRDVDKQVLLAKDNFEASVTTLYKSNGAVSGGFQQLTNAVPDVLNNVDGSTPQEIQNQAAVVKMDVSAAESQLKQDASADRTDLQTITGNAELVADGFLDVVISAPFPEALASVLKDVTTLTGEQISGIVENNVRLDNTQQESEDDQIVDPIQNIVGNLFPSLKSVSFQLNSTISQLLNNSSILLTRSQFGFNNLVENIIEKANGPAFSIITSAAVIDGVRQNIPPEQVQKILELKAASNVSGAALILKKYSDKSLGELEALISTINNKASNQVSDSQTPRDLKVVRTDNIVNLWREDTTDPNSDVFSEVIGKEITAEVLNMNREVTEIIVVFLETPNATIQSYHELYAKRYNIGFNPHFYIGYDGVIYRGRPINIEAKQTTLVTNDHYKRSIIIGVNINEKSKIHKLAPGQREKLLSLVDQILEAKPGLQVFSAKDVGWSYTTETDALNVSLFFKQKLNKINITSYNPKIKPPLTAKELAEYYIEL